VILAIFGCREVNCDEMDGHRPKKTSEQELLGPICSRASLEH